MRVRQSVPIEVRQSISYSIGEAEDGQPLIWVSGKGGWYEIFPSPTYLPIYNKMCEAAMLYYRIMDIYKTQKPKKPKKGRRPDPMIELSHLFHQVCCPEAPQLPALTHPPSTLPRLATVPLWMKSSSDVWSMRPS